MQERSNFEFILGKIKKKFRASEFKLLLPLTFTRMRTHIEGEEGGRQILLNRAGKNSGSGSNFYLRHETGLSKYI